MHRSRSRRMPFLVLALASMLFFPGLASAECAKNCLWGCTPNNCSTLPAASLSSSSCHGSPSSAGSYDLPSGTLSSSGYLTTSDRFVVEQTPGQAPVTLRLLIHFRGSGYNSYAGFGVVIPGVGQTQDQVFLPPYEPPYYLPTVVDRDYVLEVPVIHGFSFDINAQASATRSYGQGGSSDTEMTYRFETPPSGTLVRSCQGFVVDTYSVTPTRMRTWGSVKAHYR